MQNTSIIFLQFWEEMWLSPQIPENAKTYIAVKSLNVDLLLNLKLSNFSNYRAIIALTVD